MTTQKLPEEPSMEEILQSIRRIISENDENDSSKKNNDKIKSTEAEAVADDVLELCHEIQEDGAVLDLKTGEIVTDKVGSEDGRLLNFNSEEEAGLSHFDNDSFMYTNRNSESVGSGSSPPSAGYGQRPGAEGGKTIEDLAMEVMRPLIREWLDDNLPKLVERSVTKEIERLSREAEENSRD